MKLIVILSDQLNSRIAALQYYEQGDVVLMAEVSEEVEYVKHHKKKLVYSLSSMRHFASALKANKYNVDYHFLDMQSPHKCLVDVVKDKVTHYGCNNIVLTMPGEHRLLMAFQSLKDFKNSLGSPMNVLILEDNRFMSSLDEFNLWADGKKQLVMEYFYRQMRKKHAILMDGKKPVGGKWNYDKANRKALDHKLIDNEPVEFTIDDITQEVIKCVESNFNDNFGDIYPFTWAVTRKDALIALEHFCEHRLPYFGDYQDAMTSDSAYLYHAVISHYLNNGLLLPSEVCHRAEQAYIENRAPLNAIEGFIRQILGWREYVRGLYWRYMPDYANNNALNAKRPLPKIYWGGDTDMNCMRRVVRFTKKYAYSHHIHRLMVTGNFALLAGLDVKQVHEWYLAVYADAYEWVEMPNTLGMALFADGGIMATKPYAASGKYINKMSDYCKDCRYDVRQRVGENACPFNTLYWAFLERNKTKLQKNHRMIFAYKHLNNMSEEETKRIKLKAELLINELY